MRYSRKYAELNVGQQVCEHCGQMYAAHKTRQRFCSKSCSAAHRYLDPQAREISRQNMLTTIARPDVQQKLAVHLYSPDNPLRQPRNRAKAIASLQATGYKHLTGGNGQGLTEPQRILAERLQWETEVPVSTGRPTPPGYPSHYKLDIADLVRRIDIEVDGHSHVGTKSRARDAKRDTLLTKMGWTVLRFTNHDVLKNLDAVMEQIRVYVPYIT